MFSLTNNKEHRNIRLNNIKYISARNKKSFIEQGFIINEINNIIIV
jgi:hypothetical protein